MLDCSIKVSHHRPISFARRTPRPKDGDDKPIPPSIIKKAGWADAVVSAFQRLCRNDRIGAENPVRRLVLLKDAIKETSRNFRNIDEFDRIEELGPDDAQGYTMACLRALEKEDRGCVEKCGGRYPKLQEWTRQYLTNNSHSTRAYAINNIRNHAVELARDEITRDTAAIQDNFHDDPDGKVKAKESVLLKLKRLLPGEPCGINAMKTSNNATVTSPSEIAQTLKQHWQKVFKKKEVDISIIQTWMEELFIQREDGCFETGLPDASSNIWRITREHVEHAVRSARNSMPGPDGIPALAYKILGATGVDILFEVALALGTENHHSLIAEAYSDRSAADKHAYNMALLCCLPKKPCEIDPEFGEVYAGEDTRPLALVNVDNRIVASAARGCWEHILEHNYISTHQQGFLKGRYMINNILDIDYNAMTVSLLHAKGALLLFDFKAAFPSVSHAFLIDSLRSIGLPDHALNLIKALYDSNYCNIAFQGALYPGFELTRGVRQGCPISPLLFAAAVDILLRMIKSRIGSCTIKAFADDIATVVTDFPRDQALLARTFAEFERMSGLDLNIKKTICIPLWEKGVDDVRSMLREGPWKDLAVQQHGTYLGLVQGPGKGSISWQKPITKYLKRCNSWCNIHQGLYFATTAYNTFISSVLMFIAQLEVPSAEVLKAEKEGLLKMTSGPHAWRLPGDLFFLKEAYGQVASFHSVTFSAQAAKERVVAHHDLWRESKEGCTKFTNLISIYSMHSRIVSLLKGKTRFHDRAAAWGSWYNNSFIFNLANNHRELEEAGIPLQPLLDSMVGPDGWTKEATRKSKGLIQRKILTAIKNKHIPDPQYRLRDKIMRWYPKGNRDSFHPRAQPRYHLAGPPNLIARRISDTLRHLHTVVAPRVCAAVFKFLWNGWVTTARFQGREQPNCKCVLGCSSDGRPNAADAQNHYCHCPTVHKVWSNRLRTSIPLERSMYTWLLANGELADDDKLCSTALIIYSTMRAVNHYRHNGSTNRDTAAQFMQQAISQGVRGHSKSASFVNGLWDSSLHPTGIHFRNE